ncbi:MAG: hypothetical protein ACLQAH_06345 [Limisphaerales bacterium]
MIAGTELANRANSHGVSLPMNRNAVRMAWQAVGSPVRIIALLRATIQTWVPLGYEDESGFHYGADVTDWSFTI